MAAGPACWQVQSGGPATASASRRGLPASRGPVADRQHFIHVHVANVPGPASPLYLAGACLTEAFAVVPLSGNVTVGIGVVSYAGQLNISVIADRDNCPDLPVFISGLDRSLSGLTGAAAMSITPPASGSPAA